MQINGLKYYLFLFFFLSLVSPSKAGDTTYHFNHEDTLRGSLNPYRTAYDVYYYHLNLIIDPSRHTVTGIGAISFIVKHPTDSIQVDLFKNYKVLGVMDGRIWQEYKIHGDHIFIHFYDTLKVGQKRTIEIHYTGEPPVAKNPPWDGGFVWGKDSLDRTWVGVACEGLGASSWWPCKDHLSDKPDSMLISIGIPEGYFCVSNGQLKNISNIYGGFYRYDWLVTYPINTYDVTVNIGKYSRIRYAYNSKAGKLDLDYFPLDYHKDRADQYFQNQVKPMLDCFEKYFGPYPFTRDGYGLVETKYWGMEHQGAIAYGNNFLINKYGFDFIIVHESAHEWWGNSLSVADQAEMWINESFATYAESLYLECTKNKTIEQEYLNDQKKLIANQHPVIGPFGVNFYKRTDNDIYYKGAWMLHTLRNVINNDSLWFDIIYSFQQKYKYSIVTTEDFVKLVNAKTGKNFSAFFDQYLRHSELPELVFKVDKKGSKTVLSYYWKNTVKDFNMPVDLKILGGSEYRIYPTATIQKKVFKLGDLPIVEYRDTTNNINVNADKFLITVAQETK